MLRLLIGAVFAAQALALAPARAEEIDAELAARLTPAERAALIAYSSARQQFGRQQRAYWARVNAKRDARRAKRILALDYTADDYIAARRRMTIARNTIVDLFASVDVLVTPTFMRTPPTIAASLASPPDESVMIRNTLPFDVLGLPTISVPCGFTRAGLPIGVQITGPRLGEARVYALAHAYEQATDWHKREPALA